jgi:hypothetical protein
MVHFGSGLSGLGVAPYEFRVAMDEERRLPSKPVTRNYYFFELNLASFNKKSNPFLGPILEGPFPIFIYKRFILG